MSIPTGTTKVTYSFPLEKMVEPDIWDTYHHAGTFVFPLYPLSDGESSLDLTPQELSDLAESAMDNYLSNLTGAISGSPNYRVTASRVYAVPDESGDPWPSA